MRFIHTSDWHLGISISEVSMLQEQKNFIENLIRITENENIDAIIISGDIYDTNVSNSESISLFNYALSELCGRLGKKAFIIAGNHDGAARLSAYSQLLKNEGVYISGKIKGTIEPVVVGNTAVYLVPYFNIEEIRCLFPDEDIKSYESAFQVVTRNICKNMDESLKNIICAHAFVSGAKISESEKFSVVGTANMVSKDIFKGFYYTALGHLHKPQNVDKNVIYSGSPIPYSISECDDEKHLIIIDTNTDEIKEVNLSPLHKIKVLKGSCKELRESAEFCEDYIRIELEDEYIGTENYWFFKDIYPNLIGIITSAKDQTGENITLSLSEIEQLNPEQILQKFFSETFDTTLSNEEIEFFNEALREAENAVEQ